MTKIDDHNKLHVHVLGGEDGAEADHHQSTGEVFIHPPKQSQGLLNIKRLI
jgi:hypothetical protein